MEFELFELKKAVNVYKWDAFLCFEVRRREGSLRLEHWKQAMEILEAYYHIFWYLSQ